MRINIDLSILLFLATFVLLYIAYVSWKRRSYPLAFMLSKVMLASSFYSFGYANEIVQTSLERIKFWLRVEYLGIPFITTLWLLLVMHYTGFDTRLKKQTHALFFIMPVLTLVMQWTNDIHHLFYREILADDNFYFPVVTLVKGPWYWVHITYSYLAMAVSIVLLAAMFARSASLIRKQIALMALGSCVPWILNIVYLIRGSDIHLDLSPLGFALSGVVLTWVIYRFNLLRFSPIAMEKVFDSMTAGVIVTDAWNHIISYNRAAGKIICDVCGITAEDNDAGKFLARFPKLQELLGKAGPEECEVDIADNGIHRFYKAKTAPVDGKRTNLGKILVLADITESRRNYDALSASAAQLSALNTLKDKLISIVANDIHNPLVSAVHLSRLLEKQQNSGVYVELIGEIREQAENTFANVESLMECFKDINSMPVFLPMELKLRIIMQEAVNAVSIKAENKNIGILLEVPETVSVFADKEMLGLVLRNLLINAIKFTDPDGFITITAEDDKDMVVVSVKDTGVGIHPEKVQLLFQNVQGNSTAGTKGEKGAGLGLFLCRHFIHCNKGDIWVDSTPGEGSSFYFSIPASKRKYQY